MIYLFICTKMFDGILSASIYSIGWLNFANSGWWCGFRLLDTVLELIQFSLAHMINNARTKRITKHINNGSNTVSVKIQNEYFE